MGVTWAGNSLKESIFRLVAMRRFNLPEDRLLPPLPAQPSSELSSFPSDQDFVRFLRSNFTHAPFSLRDVFQRFNRSQFLEEILSLLLLREINDLNTSQEQFTNTVRTLQQLIAEANWDEEGQTNGILIDWLQILNPGVIRRSTIEEARELSPSPSDFWLIFASPSSGLPVLPNLSAKMLLLSSFLHNATWNLLELCLSQLLRLVSSSHKTVCSPYLSPFLF